MKFYVAFDTETTGLPKPGRPLFEQPHICEMAFGQFELGTGRCVACYSSLIALAGWTVPDDAARIHGITTDLCYEFGLDIGGALAEFYAFCSGAEFIVAHNMKFDFMMHAHECERAGIKDSPFRYSNARCTMELAKPICRIPPTDRMIRAGISGFKPPSLAEACRSVLGREPSGAHSAFFDMIDCAELFYKLKDQIA